MIIIYLISDINKMQNAIILAKENQNTSKASWMTFTISNSPALTARKHVW